MEHEHKVIAGVDWYIVRGDEGAVVIRVQRLQGKAAAIVDRDCLAELSVHSRTPLYRDHKTFGRCEWLNGEDCYCNSLNFTRAEHLVDQHEPGTDSFWERMDATYKVELQG